MDLNETMLDLMKRTKKGIAMFYVGTVYWLLLGVISFVNIDVKLLGLIYLIGAGSLFPLGILISKLLKIDFFAKDNPLSTMAGVLGGMQILFAPILILIFMEKVEWLPFFVAILTGAHFLPFAILYKSKGFLYASIMIIGATSIVAIVFMDQIYTILPFVLSIIYFITSLLLNEENKQVSSENAHVKAEVTLN
ncbi:hypothetical protein [Bacillus sp. FJAT-50079]|uniref:DUF7010 family protein n=1 Tax=Bacillus sp. FJAT-50079 TaxID=2833577 RepID=UPI001BCA56B5|nr:hypothetical protein [Bacillus sp. FJAT-50079]MBS4207065.1 hypothetical protein [Bacillus sp. FJAT-50079]